MNYQKTLANLRRKYIERKRPDYQAYNREFKKLERKREWKLIVKHLKAAFRLWRRKV